MSFMNLNRAKQLVIEAASVALGKCKRKVCTLPLEPFPVEVEATQTKERIRVDGGPLAASPCEGEDEQVPK